MKKILLTLLISIFLLGIVLSAQETLGTYKQNECVDLKQTCSSCSFVNFTRVSYPDGTRTLENVEAEKDGYNFNYTFCNTSQLGTYIVEGVGDVDGIDTVFVYDFLITYSGLEINTGKSILYLGFFLILILVFIANFILIGFLPQKNQQDEEGRILSINYLKYFRNVLWLVEWMLFIGIIYLVSNIAFAFLEEQMFAKVLFMIFQVCFALTPIIIIVWVIWIFVSFFHDKQFQNMLNRGIFPQGRL